MKILKKLLVAPALFSLALPVLSDSASDTLKITVTGTRSEKRLEDIPASLNVIDLDDLRDSGSSNLKDLTRYETGISVYDPRQVNYGGSTSTGNLNIRGMRNNRILFMQDGIRLPAGFYGVGYDYSNANTVDYYSLNTIDILKGPASTLYGSDALGGVIAYNTLTVDDVLKDGEDFTIELPFNVDQANQSLSGSARIAYKDEESGWSVLSVLSSSGANELKPNDASSSYVNDADIKTKSGLVTIAKQINPSTKVGFTIDKYVKDSDISRASGNLSKGYFNYTKQESDVSQIKDRYIISWEYDGLAKSNFIDNIKGKIYYQDYQTKDNWNEFQATKMFYGRLLNRDRDVKSDYDLYDESQGIDIQFTSDTEDHYFTYGIDYSLTKNKYTQDKYTITSGIESHTYFGTNYPIKRSPDTDTKRLGVYVQDEFNIGKTEVLAGVRFDNYNLDASADSLYLNYCQVDSSTCPVADLDATSITPKLAATIPLNEDLKLWGQYSRGFRAPTWWEMQASQTNLSASAPYQTQPNPDLEPESSNSYEVGIRGNYENYNFGLTGFYNSYDDFIETGVSKGTTTVDGVANVAVTTTDNVDGARIWGIEYTSEYKFNPENYGLSLIASASYLKGDSKKDDESLSNIDPFKAIAGLRYKTQDQKLIGELVTTYVGKVNKNNIINYDPGAYTTVDLLAKYSYSQSLDLSFGVNNLFDANYYQYQNIPSNASLTGIEQYREPGRNLKAGFKFTF